MQTLWSSANPCQRSWCHLDKAGKSICTDRDPGTPGWALTISSSWFWICLCTSAIWKSTSPADKTQEGFEALSSGDIPGLGQAAPCLQGGIPSQTQGAPGVPPVPTFGELQ